MLNCIRYFTTFVCFFFKVTRCVLNKIVFCTSVFICGFFEVLFFYIKQRFLGFSIPNFDVVDHRLFRGGQPSKKGLYDLTKRKVKTVINLRNGSFFMDKGVKDKSIRYLHLPFSPFEPKEHVVIEFIKIITSTTHPVFVHCFHGEDRTGLICAIYRIFIHGWGKKRAIDEMKQKGLHWWHKNLADFIENLDVQRIKLICRLV